MVRSRIPPLLRFNEKNGIEETKKINEELAMKRQQDSAELENMKADMKTKGFVNG